MFGQRMNATAVITLLCGAWTSTVIAATPYIFVNGLCGNDAWSGKYSQCSAPDGYKRTIQAALDAIPNGGVVAVRDGIYAGDGNRDLDFKGKAVRLVCANGPDACTIDCGGSRTENHRAFHFYSGETESSTVQGFTIVNGMAWKGGAVLCTNSSPKFVNCIFQANEATDDDTGGGAVYNEDSSPTFERCTFADNIAMPSASFGGGMTNERSSPTLIDCTFSDNHAWGGGGIYNNNGSNPTLENCAFSNNQAVRGAGMGNSGSSPSLSRCTFMGNSASFVGGGVNNVFSDPDLIHCIFRSNSAIDGGGIANWSSSPAVINCLFAANSATQHGGAVSNDTSSTQLINCTVYGNSAPNGGGIAAFDDSQVTSVNCILWGNIPAQVYDDEDPARSQITYTCIEGGWAGAGNISGNPLFADPDGPDDTLGTEDDNFSLTVGSACIDAGDNSVIPPTLLKDLAGLARFADDLQTPDTGSGTPPIIDMGIREYQGLFYVDDTAVGANNGTSWTDAFTSLQDALVVASAGAEIRIAQGFYPPDRRLGIATGDREATFELFSELTIRGGYAGTGSPDPDARNIGEYLTILTGDLAGNDEPLAEPAELLEHPSRGENSFHVVTIGQDAHDVILDGLTVTGGNATEGGYPSTTGSGAGIHKNYPSTAVLTDCTIIANSANFQGGGMLNSGPLTMDRCRFISNAAESGGGMENGGTEWDDPATLTNCLFTGNFAANDGGAISTKCAAIKCTNCTFSLNRAQGEAFYRGGGITGDDDTDMWLRNCIFWGNSDADGTVESSQIFQDYISQTHVNYCCVQGWTGILGGEGNFDDNPLFVDPDGDDNTAGTEDDNTRLAAGSPCIDAGDNSAIPPLVTEDLDGNPRIINGAVDRGAYERQDEEPPTGIIYVDDSAAGANNGSSWADAFKTLQDALAAVSSGNEIRVAEGVYKPDQGAGITPNDRSATFQLKNNVTIKGGYAGLGEPAPDARNIELYHTILTGDLAGDDNVPHNAADLLEEPTRSDNSYHVVTATDCNRAAVLDGFTITAGNASGPTEAQKWGGGLYDGNPTVKNCIFINNSAGFGGGGIQFSGPYYTTAAGLITDCTITHNAASIGGGIYGCSILSNCLINANAATVYSGGGVHLGQGCDTTVTDCVFSNNSAVANGGGVSLGVSGSTPIFTRCTFIANSADASGGGVASDGCTCGTYPEFHQCTFIANSAGSNGGGLYNFGYALAKMYSCLVIGNTAGNNGGGICDGTGYNDGGSLIVNCTLTHNTASEEGGGIYYGTYSERGRSIVNSILWYNSDRTGQSGSCSQICVADGTTTGLSTDHCCIQGWTGGGTGNIAKNPLFVDADGADNVPGTQDDNLHLLPDSPCIDKGRSSAVPPDSNDLDDNPRILAGSVDMGAYEFVAAPEWTLYDVIDLGTLGGQESMAYAVNNYGQIVGWASRANHAMTACRFDFTNPGNNLDLDPHGGTAGGARSINIHGDIVGVTRPDQSSHFHATLFNPSDPCDNLNLTDPCCYASDAYSINDLGQIVGHIVSSSGDWKATLFDPTGADRSTDLSAGLSNPQGNDMSFALSINNKGQIVGYAITGTTYGRVCAVLFDPAGAGDNIILTPDEDDSGTAQSINDAGQIVGWSSKTNGATLFDPCDPRNNRALGTLPGGRESSAYGINNRGQIVGSVSILVEGYTTVGHAAIFDPTGAGNNKDLNDLIDRSLGWCLSVAYGINDAGWIVGYGTNPHGLRHAFLLVPKGQEPALIAHWKLDESEGDTAKDSAGTNDGALHGGPQWQPYSGRLEGALLFDGENDYVNCGSDSAFDITGQITVAAWANFNSVNMEWQTVIAKGDSAWRLSTASNYRRYHFAVTGGPPWNYINGDIEVAANEWHHVCGTYDGANLRLYIDGVEDPAGPVPELNGVTTDDYNVYIGENEERPGRYWDGLIDDVRVYNYALTPAQVFNLCKPGVLYVDSDAPGANNGSGWADAFKCLQDALAAATNGTEIRVAQGAYRPDRGAGITHGDRQATFQLVNGVAIKGGYAGFGTPHPDARDIDVCETILSGDLAGNDAEIYDPEQLGREPTRSENAYHVVTGTQTNETAVIDGFTVTAGNANYDDFSLCNGPGMFNDRGSSTILNCTFIANFAGNDDGGGAGGAMFNLASHPTITNCKFVHNAAIALDGGEGSAGAVFNENSNPRIADCTFIGNVAGHDGGAMYNSNSDPTLTNCEFIGNLAREGGSGSYGGAVWNYGSNPVLTNCLFTGNKARSSHIGSGGGAIWAAYGSVTIINCTFNGNMAEQGGAICGDYEASFSLANCILWNDKPDEIYTRGTTPVMKYCDVQNGSPGEGNITADPCFVASGHWDNDLWIDGDYHLRSAGWRWDAARAEWTFDRVTSRCIDAGNPGSPLADEPLTIPDDPDNEYGQNVRINMGAYGGTAQASIPPYDWALLADINNDGIVDFYDFACAGLYWALTAPEQPCDLNRNGDAGLADLDLFAYDWLKTTIWHK